MSYSNSFPTQRPTLNLDFANSGKLDSRISFSRADTPPTYAAPSAVHYWSNESHLSSENLVPYSNLSSGFTFGRTTLASTNNSAPDGGSDAASILEKVDTATHEVYDTFAAVSGQQYSFVYFFKANGRTKVVVKPQATSTIAHVTYDLTAVTSTVTSGSVISHSITAIGSTGWYKCVVTVTATATGTGYTQFNLLDGSGNESYTGEVTKGVYAWGASVSSTGQTVVNQTSGSIHREYSSTLKSVTNAGDPRFEYAPASDGQSVGLLIEAQAENLQRYGSDFASWSVITNSVISSDQAIAPNGQLHADLIVPSTGNNYHYVYDALAVVTAGTVYTFSVYLKSAGYRYVQILGLGQMQPSGHVTFDLEAGTLSADGAHAGAMDNVGNGWFRASVTVTAANNATTGFLIAGADSLSNGRNPQTTGNAYDGWLAWGAQLETGSAASSLANSGTSSSGVTRAADSCSVDLGDVGYTGGEVTLVADTNTSATDDYRQAASLIDDSQNQVTLYGNSYNNRLAAILGGGESSTLSQTSANGISALSFGVNDIAATRNGASPVTDTSQAFPNVSAGNLKIGGSGSSQILNGTIKRVALYNVALSDTELQAITS